MTNRDRQTVAELYPIGTNEAPIQAPVAFLVRPTEDSTKYLFPSVEPNRLIQTENN